MNEPSRPSFSIRDIIARIRLRLPWPTRPPIEPPVRPPKPIDLDAERMRVQVGVIRRAYEDDVDGIGVAGAEGSRQVDDDADAQYLFRQHHLLVRREDFQLLDDFFTERVDKFDGAIGRVSEPTPGLMLVRVPARRDEGDDVLATLEEIDEAHRERAEAGRPLATPDHILYVTGVPRFCPATEPEEPPAREPVPPVNRDDTAGAGIQVSVVDTGLWVDAITGPLTSAWMDDVSPASKKDIEHVDPAAIHPYAGHGTFSAGIVGCMAPSATIEVEGALTKGGAISESEICAQLDQAINDDDHPQLISMSAGTYARGDFSLITFDMLAANYGLDRRALEGKKLLIVAAAGNDRTKAKFYPAAFDWVVGVGAVEPDGKTVCDFSNYGDSVKVWARGRNLVNAFPHGTYTCHEPDNIHNGVPDVRHFEGFAQWSGTSFATPIVAGAIAAHMSATGNDDDPRRAYDELYQAGSPGPHGKPVLGPL